MAAEFKIGRLRFTWVGAWVTNTAYSRDSVTQYNGKVYACLAPHTSGVFNTDFATSGYWSLIAEGKTWIPGGWLPSTYYYLGNLVAFGGAIYVCTAPHTSSTTFDGTKWTTWTLFDNWHTSWATSTNYGIGDVVKYGGIVYRCNTNHVSAGAVSSGLEANQSFWTVVDNGIDYKGAWIPSVRYKLNDIVKVGPDLYMCTSYHTSGSVFAAGNFSIWLPGMEFTGTWSNVATYQPGDTVSYGGYNYTSKTTNNLNNVPSTDATDWALLDQGYELKTDWANTVGYKVGDIVCKNGYLYEAIQDTATTTIASVVIADSAGTLTVSSGSYFVGQAITVTGTLSGLSGFTGYTSGTVYYIGKVNSSTSIQITSSYANATASTPVFSVVTTSGTPTGLIFTILVPADPTAFSVANTVNTSGSSGTTLVVGGTFTATTSSTVNPTILTSVSSFTNLAVGQGISGTGIPTGTTIASLNSIASTVTMSASATQSNTITVTYGSTAGIVPGMIVLGSGFTRGQSVVSTTSPNIVTLNYAPDSSLTNGQSVSFVGVNYVYWTLITPGNNWKNRWLSASAYSIGDLVVWQNTTYTCVQSHTSTALNRPDLDATSTYWSFYVAHARKNALNSSGDILTYNNGAYSAVALGSQGYNLRVNSNIPAWQKTNTVSSVYYVSSSNGIDRSDYGTTWDQPWKTIAYACNIVGAGTQYQNTAFLIKSNKSWITAELTQWAIYQAAQNISPFTSSYVVDQTKTPRDAGYIIDAIVYDITRSGNSQTCAAALSYFAFGSTNTFFNSAVTADIPYYLPILTQLLSLINSALSNTPPATSYQTLNVVSNPVGFSANNGIIVDSGGQTLVASLLSIITTALTNANTATIPPQNSGETATIFVKTGTYSETLPISIPENVALVGDELRGAVVQPNVIINTTATATSSVTNLITVANTAGMVANTPVQFSVSIGGLSAGTTYYVVGASITSTQFSVASFTPANVPLTLTTTSTSAIVYGGDAVKNMFYMRNGSGLRNMTLTGLLGFLSAPDAYLISRPTGGAFTSLDPGNGATDTSVWIFRRSPYVQNVTTFGTGCIGVKIDGSLHNGGNKSIVANDFTQVLSDGVGAWCTGSGAVTELVSVFSYYNYAGYLAEAGGRMRATNGNSSYGTYGCVATGFDTNETPGTGVIFNRSLQVQASVQSSLGASAQLVKFNYSNSGNNYLSTTTNLLNYSNTFNTGWSSDNNVTIQKNAVAPTGYTEAWSLTGNTAGPDGSYIYQNITIPAAGGYYTSISGTNSGPGSGAGATFNITVTNTSYVVTVASGGSGYVVGNQISILGATLGGVTGINDLTLTVSNLTGSAIATPNGVTAAGTIPTAATTSYTLSLNVYLGTASSIDLYGIFSGSSTVTSSINYNFSTNTVTASSANGGYVPVQYGKIPSTTTGWYRIWFAIQDTTGLNTTLQYRIYPRGYAGLTGKYTIVYGAGVEISSSSYTPSFYLETTNTRYTAYANFGIVGSGSGSITVADEIRTGAIFETRSIDSGSGAGGSGYLTASNNAQAGTTSYIQLSAADVNTAANYTTMRLFINSGTGAGQYGYIGYYNASTKIAQILKESFDSVQVIATNGSTNAFNLGTVNFGTMYVNQPIQFIPTYYTVSITGTSLGQQSVTQAVGGVTNQLTVASTTSLSYNQPVLFTTTGFTNLLANYTYYIYSVVDGTHIQLSTQASGSVWPLTAGSGTMTMNYSTFTGYLSGNTSNMSVNLSISFTGTALGGISVGVTYYINDIIDTATFTISNSLVTVTPTASSSGNNGYTVSSTGTMVPLNPIVFSGTVFGGVTAGLKYYISNIINPTTFSVASSLITVTASATTVTTNLITVSSTAGFVVNNPIVFVGSAFGGIVSETTYYILAVQDGFNFTVSATVGGSAITLSTATGSLIVKTCPTAVLLSTVGSGSMTGTSTSKKFQATLGYNISGSMNATFGTPLFGGITAGTTYYINTIDTANNAMTITGTQFSNTPFVPTTATGSMNFGAVGWDNVNSGAPSAALLDSTSLYYIEPRLTYNDPSYSQTISASSVTLTSGTNWISMAYGNGYFMAIPSASSLAARSLDGNTWTSFSLPSSASWTGVAYGNNYWVVIANGTTQAAYSANNGLGWKTSSMPSGTSWSNIAYGNGIFVAIATGTTSSAYSLNFGANWSSGSGLPNATWTGLAYGAGRFVAVSSGGTQAAYSTNGTTWASSTLPSSTTWSSIAYGNGRFVAVSSTSNTAAYSFDGITWYSSNITLTANLIAYGNGTFVAIPTTSTTGYVTDNGLDWKIRSITSASYSCMAYGVISSSSVGVFPTLSGTGAGTYILAGVRAKGRASISSNVITSITHWEPGSNYAAGVLTVTDPNVTTLATLSPRVGSGALGNPTFVSRGSGYTSTSTVITITGNGYADAYQTGYTIIMNNLSRLPLVGDNLTITGISSVYKVTSATAIYGTVAPNIQANVQISPAMTAALSPANNTAIQIRTKYSQVRLTNHDFLYIGTGNFTNTSYPSGVSINNALLQNQTVELNFGRVFYTSTDQDGNFKVGSLFGVQQSTGIVTLSASQFGLVGLSTLSLGGVALGGSGVVVTGFSTDATFTANSDAIIPTQKAIKSYITSRLSQGGSNTTTGQLTAGTILVGGANKIASTISQGIAGSNVKMVNKVNFQGVSGNSTIDGNMAALDFFVRHGVRRTGAS